MIKEKSVNIEDYLKILEKRGIKFSEDSIYILPASIGESEDKDLLNPLTPDIFKTLRKEKVNAVVVKGKNRSYLTTKSADVILPIFIGVTSSVISGIILNWIYKNFENHKTVKLSYISKTSDGNYKEFTIEGRIDELQATIDKIKDI